MAVMLTEPSATVAVGSGVAVGVAVGFGVDVAVGEGVGVAVEVAVDVAVAVGSIVVAEGVKVGLGSIDDEGVTAAKLPLSVGVRSSSVGAGSDSLQPATRTMTTDTRKNHDRVRTADHRPRCALGLRSAGNVNDRVNRAAQRTDMPGQNPDA